MRKFCYDDGAIAALAFVEQIETSIANHFKHCGLIGSARERGGHCCCLCRAAVSALILPVPR